MERNEGKTSAERRMDIWIFFKWRKLSLTEQTNCVRRRKSSWDMAKKKGLKMVGIWISELWMTIDLKGKLKNDENEKIK